MAARQDTALVAGETQSMIATIGSLFNHIKAGRVRPIGVTSETRTTQFPEVPAIAEAVPGYEFTAWVACFAPAGTPQPIVDKLNAELKRALGHPRSLRKAQRPDPRPDAHDAGPVRPAHESGLRQIRESREVIESAHRLRYSALFSGPR